jgi:hypothetical protein
MNITVPQETVPQETLDWRFRGKPATDSDPNRPPIPLEIGH